MCTMSSNLALLVRHVCRIFAREHSIIIGVDLITARLVRDAAMHSARVHVNTILPSQPLLVRRLCPIDMSTCKDRQICRTCLDVLMMPEFTRSNPKHDFVRGDSRERAPKTRAER